MESLKQELIQLSIDFHQRGWSFATSGNFSVRLDEGRVLVTGSGKDKASLTANDFVATNLDGAPIVAESGVQPSAETVLHCSLYRFDPEIGAILHTHSMFATLLSAQYFPQGFLTLQGYEMLKALRGVSTHEHTETIPEIG